jgi:hypothetical protein
MGRDHFRHLPPPKSTGGALTDSLARCALTKTIENRTSEPFEAGNGPCICRCIYLASEERGLSSHPAVGARIDVVPSRVMPGIW